MAQQILDRIRDHLAETGLSRSGLAKAAGLHANTLRDLDDAGWNPTAETLKNVVIDDWFFGVSAISADGYESPVVFPGAAGSFSVTK